MTPLLTLLLLATPPTTIHPQTHTPKEPITMIQQNPNVSYPIRHPHPTTTTNRSGATQRIGMSSKNPTLPRNHGGYPSPTGHNTITNSGIPNIIEHTNRPH